MNPNPNLWSVKASLDGTHWQIFWILGSCPSAVERKARKCIAQQRRAGIWPRRGRVTFTEIRHEGEIDAF